MSADPTTSLAAATKEYVDARGVVTPAQFGCVGNGVADDTTCLQSAMNSLASTRGTLYLNALYKITSGLTDAGVRLQGNYTGNGFATHVPTGACPFGITVATANIAAITATADGTVIDSLCIDHKGVSDTSGVGISIGALNNVTVSSSQIIGACVGIDVSGSSSAQNVGTTIEADSVMGVDVAGCADLRIGHNTIGATTTDGRVDKNGFFCPTAANLVGVEIEDAGGFHFTSNEVLACGIGTRIFPGVNQQVIFLYFTGTVLGDSSNTNDFLVDTQAASAQVRSLAISNSWASSAANGPSVLVQSTGAGTVFGVHFNGFRSFPHAGQTAVWFKAPTGSVLSDLTIDASYLCMPAGEAAVAAIIDDIAGFTSIRNSTIGVCDASGSLGPAGGPGLSIAPSGQAAAGIFTNNNIHTINTPIIWGGNPSTSTVVIDSNGGMDNPTQQTWASAPSVTQYSGWFMMSGTATVQTMLPAWPGRRIVIVPTAAWSTTTGGNIGTIGTATTGVPTSWIYNGLQWNVHF